MSSSIIISSRIQSMVESVVSDVVSVLGSKYCFDVSEALSSLSLSCDVRSGGVRGRGAPRDVSSLGKCNSAFPLPFSGNVNGDNCQALRQCGGIYSQCVNNRVVDDYCKSCNSKTVDGVPEYGTIKSRLEAGLYEYVDPKGRKPVHYTKIMKKYKITEEQVVEEAKKFGQIVNPIHFTVPETESVKRGRPKIDKPVKVSNGVKGRPKKAKKVIEIAGEEDDLFACLVAESINNNVVKSVVTSAVEPVATSAVEPVATSAVEPVATSAEDVSEEIDEDAQDDLFMALVAAHVPEESVVEVHVIAVDAPVIKTVKTTVDKEQAKLEKAAKELTKANEKAAKEAEKAAKELAKEAEKAAKELAKSNEKAAKELAKSNEKAAKELAKANEKAVKEKSVEKSVENEEPAGDVVKKIEYEGKKYLKSKQTGVIYDYDEYVKCGDQVVVGKWNNTTSKIDFETNDSDAEESEEEYEDE